MCRIKDQNKEHHNLALQVLSWITNAVRPLRLEELQHAVSVEIEDDDIDDGPLESAALIVSVCAGLVTVDAESRNVRLVHFTVEEFFRESHNKWFPHGNNVIAKTCLTYLSFNAFGKGPASALHNSFEFNNLKTSLDARLEKYALLRYAAQNWSTHIHQASLTLKEVQSIAMKFLGDELKVAAAYQAYKAATIVPLANFLRMARFGFPEKLPGIHLVVKMQCEAFARSWQACGGDINAKDEYGETALLDSGRVKNLGMTRCLLDSGVDVNGSSCGGYTALMAAASRGWAEGVKLLLGRGAEANAKTNNQSTALHNACCASSYLEASQRSCAGLLLQAGADIDARDRGGNTPLLVAAGRGAQNEAVVELLLEHKADVNLVNVRGESALMTASWHHDMDGAIIKLLLQYEANVHLVNLHGRSALMIAVMGLGYEEKVKLLLQHGADVNVVDVNGQSALMISVHCLHVKAAELLLQNGADVNVVDKEEKTVVNIASDGYLQRRGTWDDVRDMMRILSLGGLNEQNREKARSFVCEYLYTDKELVQMLSSPPQTVATAEATWEE
jgi:ankyrin repeat protein